MFMKNHGTIWFEYFVETEVVQNKIPDHQSSSNPVSQSTLFPVYTIKSNLQYMFLIVYALFNLKQQQITESKTDYKCVSFNLSLYIRRYCMFSVCLWVCRTDRADCCQGWAVISMEQKVFCEVTDPWQLSLTPGECTLSGLCGSALCPEP